MLHRMTFCGRAAASFRIHRFSFVF